MKELLKEAEGDWLTAVYIGVFTGARLGDCVSMKWRNVDLAARTIEFTPAKTRRKGTTLTVPVHPALEAHLMGLPTTDDPDAFLCPELTKQRINGRSGLSRQFQVIMHGAGINQESGQDKKGAGRVFRKYGFHSLRHSFNSELANSGVDQELRKALAGHASAEMNQRYTHREMDTLRRAVERLPNV